MTCSKTSVKQSQMKMKVRFCDLWWGQFNITFIFNIEMYLKKGDITNPWPKKRWYHKPVTEEKVISQTRDRRKGDITNPVTEEKVISQTRDRRKGDITNPWPKKRWYHKPVTEEKVISQTRDGKKGDITNPWPQKRWYHKPVTAGKVISQTRDRRKGDITNPWPKKRWYHKPVTAGKGDITNPWPKKRWYHKPVTEGKGDITNPWPQEKVISQTRDRRKGDVTNPWPKKRWYHKPVTEGKVISQTRDRRKGDITNPLTEEKVIQWNLYKTDTLGEIESVRLTEVSVLRGFSILGQYLENNENGHYISCCSHQGGKKRLLRTLKETKHVFFWFAIFFSRNFF